MERRGVEIEAVTAPWPQLPNSADLRQQNFEILEAIDACRKRELKHIFRIEQPNF